MNMMLYWKATNETETHRGLQYHDGENADPLHLRAAVYKELKEKGGIR